LYGAVFQTDVGFRVIWVKAQKNYMWTWLAGNEATTILVLLLNLLLLLLLLLLGAITLKPRPRMTVVRPRFGVCVVSLILRIARPGKVFLIRNALFTPFLLLY
jgi:hypothetical protein